MLEFNDEMLMPQINALLYYEVYELENWLRRICLTAYMLEFGDAWLSEIPEGILKGLQKRACKAEDLVYLGIGKTDNPIWFTSLGQLEQLLEHDEISLRMQNITEYSVRHLLSTISELRELRNVLAHNRALSPKSFRFAVSIRQTLQHVISNWKQAILYARDTKGLRLTERGEYFADRVSDAFSHDFQVFLSSANGLYKLTRLPCSHRHFGQFFSARKAVTRYESVMDSILAFAINISGTEYSILIPEKMSDASIEQVIDSFLEDLNVWTTIDYEQQEPEYVCHPKFWFYENA